MSSHGCHLPNFTVLDTTSLHPAWEEIDLQNNFLRFFEDRNLSACDFYGFKFQLLTKVLIPTIIHLPGNQGSPPSFPFIPLLHTHVRRQDEQDGL